MTRIGLAVCLLLALLSPAMASQPDGLSRPGILARISALQEEMRNTTAACGGDARMAELQAQINALAAQLPRGREGTLDQGGENCFDATVIDSLPYCDFGSTMEALDDFAPPSGCGGTSAAPDVVYEFTSPTDQLVGVSLCGSAFNTILYVWELCPGPAPAHVVCCNDDAPSCSPQSCCPQVFMRAGFTYYIIIDGAGTDRGDYVLHVGPPSACPAEPCPPCSVACPSGALAEGEGCPSGFPDYYNAGCFSYPFYATTLNCGQTMCGSTYWGGHQDHDAYIVTTTQRDSLIWCISAEFNFIAQVHQFFSAG